MSYFRDSAFAPRKLHLGGFCPTCGRNLGGTGDGAGESPVKKAGIGFLNLLILGILAYITYRVVSKKPKQLGRTRKHVRQLPLPR